MPTFCKCVWKPPTFYLTCVQKVVTFLLLPFLNIFCKTNSMSAWLHLVRSAISLPKWLRLWPARWCSDHGHTTKNFSTLRQVWLTCKKMFFYLLSCVPNNRPLHLLKTQLSKPLKQFNRITLLNCKLKLSVNDYGQYKSETDSRVLQKEICINQSGSASSYCKLRKRVPATERARRVKGP